MKAFYLEPIDVHRPERRRNVYTRTPTRPQDRAPAWLEVLALSGLVFWLGLACAIAYHFS